MAKKAQKQGSDPISAQELRRLKRTELLTIMLEQSMEIDRLRAELETTRAQMEEMKTSGQEQLTENVNRLQQMVTELTRRIDAR